MVSGNTPTLRLEQNGSSGFTPQTWDVAGNEANFFIRDATNGSKLPFRIEPGARTNSIYIDNAGLIGLGTTSPSALLTMKNGGAGDAGLPRIRLTNDDAPTEWNFDVTDLGAFRISAQGTGDSEMELRGGSNSGACLQLRDSDAAGISHITVLNGVMTTATGPCPTPS